MYMFVCMGVGDYMCMFMRNVCLYGYEYECTYVYVYMGISTYVYVCLFMC